MPGTTRTMNDEQLLEVPNIHHGEFPDSVSQTASKRGSLTSLEDITPRLRLDTFPYVMDGEDIVSGSSHIPLHQQKERVEHVVYEMTDTNVHGKPAKANDGKKESGMVIQEEEHYDDIRTSGVIPGQRKQLFDNDVYKAPLSPQLSTSCSWGKLYKQ